MAAQRATPAASERIRVLFMEFLSAEVGRARKLNDREIVIHPPEANGNAPGRVRSSGKNAENLLRKSVFLRYIQTGVTFLHRHA
jgi:hypothetical protein